MKQLWMVIASVVLLVACDSEEASTTQVMLEVDADDAVRARMQSLRILISVSDDDGETWRDKVDKTFSAGSGGLRDWRDFAWPARLGLVPEGGAVDRLFSVRVHALDEDDQLFVWQQAVAGFEAGQIKVLRMRLASACAVELLTCGDAECVGADGCTTCSDGECIDVEILSQLPDYDPSFAGDGAVDFDGSVEGDGGHEPLDGGADAGDGAVDPGDAGGDGAIEDAGSDSGCTDCDGALSDPFEASVTSALLELDAPIEIAFNADVEASTVTAANIAVLRGDDEISGELEVNGDSVTFTPDALLALGATYRIELSADIEAEDGRALEATELAVATRDCAWSARDVEEGSAPNLSSAPGGFTVLTYDAPPTVDPGPTVVWATTHRPGEPWDEPVQASATGGGGLSYFGSKTSANDAEQVAIAYYYDTDGYLYGGTRTSDGTWTVGFIATQSVPRVEFDLLMLPNGTRELAHMIGGDLTVGGATPSGAGTAGPVIARYGERSIVVWAEGSLLRTFTTADSTTRNAPSATLARTGLAIDADAQNASAVVVWEQVDPSWPNVWSARIVDSSGEPQWSDALRISSDTSAASAPDVAVDGEGAALAVWQEGAAASSRIYAASLEPGGAWDEVTPLSDQAVGAATRARIVSEAGGNAFALWRYTIAAGSEIWAVRYLAESGWQLGERQRLSSEGIESTSLEVSIDAAGRAHAAWREGTLIRTASCE